MTEHQEQALLVSTFRLKYPEAAGLLFAVPNGAHLAGGKAQRARQMAALKAEGLMVGAADLVLLVARGGYHGLVAEMKIPGNDLSAEQVAFMARAAAAGYYDCAAWSADEMMGYMDWYMGQTPTKAMEWKL